MRKTFFFFLIAVLFLCTSCKDKIKPGNVEPGRKEVTGIKIMDVKPVLTDVFYETSGTIKAKNVSIISSRLMGTVTKIMVREGDRVKAGDILIFIDDSDSAQKKIAAEAGYIESQKALEASMNHKNLAEITFERYAKLYEEKVISQQEFDQIKTQKNIAAIEYERTQQAVRRAEAVKGEALAYYGFTKIKAPYTGIVTSKKIDVGTMAVPGTPLMVVEDSSQFKVEVSVDERLYKSLVKGAGVLIIIPSTKEKIEGKIARIAPAIDLSTRTFNVEILVKDVQLRTGLYAKVLIPEGKREAVLLPKKAVVEKGQLTGVYLVNEKGVISYNLVKTGKIYGEEVEILSGLNKNGKIIVEGLEKAVDGGIVKK